MIRGERRGHVVVVAVEEVPEVPRAVADVDLGIEQVARDESVPPRPCRDPLRGVGQELHQANGPCLRACGRVELALGVDDGGKQGGRQVVVPRVRLDDRLVAKRVADALVPLRLRRQDPGGDPGYRRRGQQRDQPDALHAGVDASSASSAITSPTQAWRSSNEPVLT